MQTNESEEDIVTKMWQRNAKKVRLYSRKVSLSKIEFILSKKKVILI